MAAAVKSILVFAACFLATAWGLQVAPNSPCSSICTDGGSDPNQSNFIGSDIVCKDSDYPSSAAGQRFSGCINCLQNSTFSGSGQSDQAWFLYNLRFALNTCIYGEANATDPVNTPCSTELDCGPMQGALQDGMSDPSTAQEYSYCSAYDNSFLGSSLSKCSQCLSTGGSDLFYMSNFLVALDAGCIQQPPAGVLIGLNSTLFSNNQVAITSPATAVSGSNSSKKLSTGAIIGIAIAGAVTLLVIVAAIFVCARKHSNSKRLQQIRSPLDSRFGAGNISAPYKGNYGSPDSPPLLKEDILMKEGSKVVNFSRQNPRRVSDGTVFSFQESPAIPQYSPAPTSHYHSSAQPAPYNQHAPPYNKFAPPVSSPQQTPLPLGADSIPIHPAYIPGYNTTPPMHTHSSTSSTMSPPLRPEMSPPLPRSGPSPHPQRSPSNGPLSGTSTRSGPSTASTVSPMSVNRAPSRGPGQGRDVIREVTIARDISAGRGHDSAPGAISGPIINVGNRFDRFESEEEARKAREEEAKRAREKLYKEGVGGLKIPFSKKWKGRPNNSPDKTSPADSEGGLW